MYIHRIFPGHIICHHLISYSCDTNKHYKNKYIIVYKLITPWFICIDTTVKHHFFVSVLLHFVKHCFIIRFLYYIFHPIYCNVFLFNIIAMLNVSTFIFCQYYTWKIPASLPYVCVTIYYPRQSVGFGNFIFLIC